MEHRLVSPCIKRLLFTAALICACCHASLSCPEESALYAGGSAKADQEDTQQRGYVIDILEESAASLVKQCYWDFGRWSDLWRVWRPVGTDRPFREAPVTLGVRSWTAPWTPMAFKLHSLFNTNNILLFWGVGKTNRNVGAQPLCR